MHARKYEEELEKRREILEEKFMKLNEQSEEYKKKYKTRAYQ
jgi:chaperonin cofactor prefoldin